MATAFKLEIASPGTKTTSAKSWVFTGDSAQPEAVSQISTEIRKDHRRISTLTALITDPKWLTKPLDSLFTALPDPAFNDIPCRLWLAPPGSPREPTTLVFDGKLTSLQPSFPAPTLLTVVATDRSIDARKNAQLRTFKNKTSVQIAAEIAKDYSYTLDLDTGDVVPKARAIDLGYGGSVGGGKLSDWDHLCRALNADGFEVHMEGTKLVVKRTQSTQYPTTFRHGAPGVLSFVPIIEHVRGPGASGDNKTPVALEDKGTKAAATATAQEQAALKASARTHRNPIEGQASTQDGAHAERPPEVGWTNLATRLNRRKDTATLSLLPTPDLQLQHVVIIQGWGGKCDGPWYADSIRHQIVGSTYAATTVSLHRAASAAAAKSAGVAFGT